MNAVACVLGFALWIIQAQLVSLHVTVRAEGKPVENAEVMAMGRSVVTDSAGVATIEVAAGTIEVTVRKEGFVPATLTIQAVGTTGPAVFVELERQPTIEETVTVIATTRTDKRLEDQALRVEVLPREEIEEKMLMTPGDIVMMLNEMGGMRVQATSPALGAASVRIQGMRGRYTRVLSDGLPLFGDVGGLGLLQIPPMDLGQVEVIKGVASAMYGAGAMGGVVNLLSRRPAATAEREFLFNRSTRGATDATLFLSSPLTSGWSVSLLGGGHWQDIVDVNDDAWADLSGYSRGVARPRLFWSDGKGGSFYATVGVTYEDRVGGTPEGLRLPMTGQPYVESLETRKYDAGAIGQRLLANRYVLTARFAAARQRHQHVFGDAPERDRHDTTFGEVALRGSVGRRHTWVGGLAIERDRYQSDEVPRFDYSFTVPGAFAQYDVDLARHVSVSSSARVDAHSEYGTFVSPRVSGLIRGGRWSSRLSIGTGFFSSTPITEETEAAGLTRLTVNRSLKAERGLSASMDITRSDGPISYTATLFASRISDGLHVDRSVYELSNLSTPTTNRGAEWLVTLRREPVSVTATYTYVRSRETADGRADAVALTPSHSGGIVAMWEKEDVGRLGIEWYYTGSQRLEENPYREESQPYTIIGLLGEKHLGRVRLFINGENLTNVRQTRWDPLLRRTRSIDGRWNVDGWAPLEGRTVNGGVRLRF